MPVPTMVDMVFGDTDIAIVPEGWWARHGVPLRCSSLFAVTAGPGDHLPQREHCTHLQAHRSRSVGIDRDSRTKPVPGVRNRADDLTGFQPAVAPFAPGCSLRGMDNAESPRRGDRDER